MEIERLEFKVVMDDGPNTEVLARVAHLDLAGPAYRAAVLKYPNRNIALRHGALIIEQHLGEPPPPPLVQRDPNLKSWSAHLIGGKKMQLLGYIEAVSEAAAIERAVVLFTLDDEQQAWRLICGVSGLATEPPTIGWGDAAERAALHERRQEIHLRRHSETKKGVAGGKASARRRANKRQDGGCSRDEPAETYRQKAAKEVNQADGPRRRRHPWQETTGTLPGKR